MTNPRVLYLPRMHAISGHDAVAGREFLGLLRAEGFDLLVRHCVVSDERWDVVGREWRDDVMRLSDVKAFAPDCIISEHGLVADPNNLRIPADWLSNYLLDGGVVITDGLGRGYGENSAGTWPALEAEAALLKITGIDGKPIWGEPGHAQFPPYIKDWGEASYNEQAVGCRPGRIIIEPWLESVWRGIDRLLVGAPVPLGAGYQSSILATTETSAQLLAGDQFLDWHAPFTIAKVLRSGSGAAAVITGDVISDHWVKMNPDNAIWLRNLAVHLVDTARREREMRTPPSIRATPAFSAASLIATGEGTTVEFKESARVDTKTGTVEVHITHAILKTIAAFTNTDGGTLLIGVRNDDGHAAGIALDLESLKSKPNLDGFSLWLNTAIKNALGEAAAARAAISFESVDGNDVCRVQVTPSKNLVYLTADRSKDDKGNVRKDNKALWVRLNGESQELTTPAAVEDWIREHRPG